jgi:hypothetical protein
MIEQWLSNETLKSCKNASIGPSNAEWHATRVLPYVNMSIKGFVWCESRLAIP